MKKKIELHYIKHRKRMVLILKNRAGTPQNAEDIVQDAFECALRYRNSFDPSRQGLGAWFNAILNNCLRRFKKDERLLGMSVEYVEELDDPVNTLDWTEDIVKLISGEINRKNMPVRQALWLYFFKGYKPREIAQVVEMSNCCIRTSVKEFRQKMQAKYGDVV